MALRDTIGRILSALARRFDGNDQTTTTDEGIRRSSVMSTSARFRLEASRRAGVLDARKMYEDDTRVQRILSTLAGDATHGGFSIEVMEAASASQLTEAQEACDDLIKRLELQDRLDDWARLSFRDGDSFLEIGVAADRLIQEITRKPTLLMRRDSNSSDKFDDPTKAYWHSDQSWATSPPPDATWFAEWQIMHARWLHDEGQRYGQPLLKTARSSYKRMREGEFDMAIRRKTRAGLKFLHVIEGADDVGIQSYRERNKDALTDPFAAVADFFSNSKGAIQTIQGDAKLAEIGDVLHQMETFFVASPVPMSLIGYGRSLNRDVLKSQKEQYDEILPTVTRWIETNLLRPLVELQWMLLDLWPGEITWRVVWNTKQVIVAEDLEKVSKAIGSLQATALLDGKTLLDIIEVFLPNVDLTRAREELEKREEGEESRMDTAAILARQALQGQDGEDDQDDEENEDGEKPAEERMSIFRRLGLSLRERQAARAVPSFLSRGETEGDKLYGTVPENGDQERVVA